MTFYAIRREDNPEDDERHERHAENMDEAEIESGSAALGLRRAVRIARIRLRIEGFCIEGFFFVHVFLRCHCRLRPVEGSGSSLPAQHTAEREDARAFS